MNSQDSLQLSNIVVMRLDKHQLFTHQHMSTLQESKLVAHLPRQTERNLVSIFQCWYQLLLNLVTITCHKKIIHME